jgi:hypothetical protein
MPPLILTSAFNHALSASFAVAYVPADRRLPCASSYTA